MAGSLRSRDFIVTSLGYFFLFLSSSVFYLYPLFLDGFNASKSSVGLIMGIHSVTAILIRPFSGRFMDEKGARPSAILGISIMILSIPGFYLVRSAGLAAVALRALNGAGWGLASTAMMKIGADSAPSERMAHSLGILGAAGIVSS
ncbi:MAG TPA: MFS transporter, partial [Acidobacteriota bacterium]|nr:MFS transporter [Acidobacteriota bacterium]